MGRVETPGDPTAGYTKRGASGEYGRYQFMPDTWRQWATEAGVATPLEQSSMEEQNKVAYYKVKQLKDQGYNPAQIASIWNSGDPEAYKRSHVGTNAQGVSYNTPEHVRRVSEAYQQIKGGGQLGGTYAPPPQAQPFTPAITSGVEQIQQQMGIDPKGGLIDRLGAEVGQAFDKAGTAIQSGLQAPDTPGKQNPLSGVLQAGGALAGGVGGVVDESLKSIPVLGGVYEGATDLLGGAISGAIQSEPGQKAMETLGVDEWSDEVKKNAEALLNVASVVPLGRGIGLGIKGARDARTAVTMGSTQAAARDEVVGSLTQKPKRGLVRAEERGQDPVGLILNQQEYMPETKFLNDRQVYDTKASLEKIERDLEADELALQNLLDSTVATQAAGISLDTVKKQALEGLMPKGKLNVNVEGVERFLDKFFDNAKRSFGRDYINLTDLNELKRQARKPINYDAVDPFAAVSKEIGGALSRNLMNQVEEYAKKAGVKGVKELNKDYGTRISAKNILEFLDERPIKSQGTGGGIIKSFSREVPFLEGTVDYTTRKLKRTPLQRLKDKRPLRETARRGLIQLGTGLAGTGQLTSGE